MVNSFNSINIVKVVFNMFMICFISAFCTNFVSQALYAGGKTMKVTVAP